MIDPPRVEAGNGRRGMSRAFSCLTTTPDMIPRTPMNINAVHGAVAALFFALPLHGQEGRTDIEVRFRNQCRLAAQVLETGHPHPHREWRGATSATARTRDRPCSHRSGARPVLGARTSRQSCGRACEFAMLACTGSSGRRQSTAPGPFPCGSAPCWSWHGTRIPEMRSG